MVPLAVSGGWHFVEAACLQNGVLQQGVGCQLSRGWLLLYAGTQKKPPDPPDGPRCFLRHPTSRQR